MCALTHEPPPSSSRQPLICLPPRWVNCACIRGFCQWTPTARALGRPRVRPQNCQYLWFILSLAEQQYRGLPVPLLTDTCAVPSSGCYAESSRNVCVGVFAGADVCPSLHKYPGWNCWGTGGGIYFNPPGATAVPWEVGFPTVLSSALCPGGRPLEVTGPAPDHRGIRFPNDHSTC